MYVRNMRPIARTDSQSRVSSGK